MWIANRVVIQHHYFGISHYSSRLLAETSLKISKENHLLLSKYHIYCSLVQRRPELKNIDLFNRSKNVTWSFASFLENISMVFRLGPFTLNLVSETQTDIFAARKLHRKDATSSWNLSRDFKKLTCCRRENFFNLFCTLLQITYFLPEVASVSRDLIIQKNLVFCHRLFLRAKLAR